MESLCRFHTHTHDKAHNVFDTFFFWRNAKITALFIHTFLPLILNPKAHELPRRRQERVKEQGKKNKEGGRGGKSSACAGERGREREREREGEGTCNTLGFSIN